MKGFFWPPEKIDELKRLWALGMTCSQIAAELGDVSRNAVIGKAARMGLAPRLGHTRARPNGRKGSGSFTLPPKSHLTGAALTKPKLAASPIPTNAEDLARSPASLVQFADLEAHHCRWPIGEVGTPTFGFCGHQRATGHPSYCPGHAARAVAAPGVTYYRGELLHDDVAQAKQREEVDA